GRESAEALVLADRHREVLEPDPPGQVRGRILEKVLPTLLAVEAVDLTSGLGDVAEVGQEYAPALADHADAVRPGVAAEVTDVDQIRDDERVELPLAEQGLQAIRAGHAASLRAPRRSSRASR